MATIQGRDELLSELKRRVEEIVCTEGCDRGVVMLSCDGPTHYDAEAKCQVYDHENFSPLGDALIGLHDLISQHLDPDPLTVTLTAATCERVGAFGCIKNTIRLRSGLYFDFIDPKPDQFRLADIAGALSKICRFGGQADYFYSVAEHSYHCAQQAVQDGLPLDAVAAVLLHDATEAFCGDMVKPLKIMLAGYSEVEDRVEAVIASKYGIDFDKHRQATKEIDHAMLIAERKAMFSKDDVLWHGENEVRPLNVHFGCWMPDEAEKRFMRLANELDVKPCT